MAQKYGLNLGFQSANISYSGVEDVKFRLSTKANIM